MTPNQLYLLSVLLGQVMPPVTDVVNKHIGSSTVRFWISLVISAVIAIALNYQTVTTLNIKNLDQVLTVALLLWTSGQAAYKTYYQGSKVQTAIRFSTKPLI